MRESDAESQVSELKGEYTTSQIENLIIRNGRSSAASILGVDRQILEAITSKYDLDLTGEPLETNQSGERKTWVTYVLVVPAKRSAEIHGPGLADNRS